MDKISTAERSENMRRILSKDMKPELHVRRLIHSMGYRYRLHRKDLPGSPDLVFPVLRKVIFVHGCFWHQHKKTGCPRTRVPKSNLHYWLPKLQRNIIRDSEALRHLRKLGWQSLVIWECEIKNEKTLEKKISNFLK